MSIHPEAAPGELSSDLCLIACCQWPFWESMLTLVGEHLRRDGGDEMGGFGGYWCLFGDAAASPARSISSAVAVCELPPAEGERQGLTLVHFSAQPEPFLTQNIP